MRFTAFVRDVLHVRLTAAQRVLCLVAFDGADPCDLTGRDRELARQLFGDVERIPPEARAVLVAVCGGRSGKSYVLVALYSLWRALVADLSALAPGEVAAAVVVAPDMRLARQALRFALGAAKSAPSIAPLIIAEGSDGFTLQRPDGQSVSIEVLPATRGGSALRGRSLVCACLDECAFFRDESAVVNDQEIFRAVTPRVLSGGMVIVASTPWAEDGLLYDEFTSNWGKPSTAIAAHAPTLLLNPSKRPEVERERKRDPENARREFDAEFMPAGSGLFFDRDTVRAAVDPELGFLGFCPEGASARIGGDLGLVRDAAAFVAIHRRRELLTLADLLEFKPQRGAPLKLSAVVGDGCAFAERHGERTVHADHHVLEPAREHLPQGFWLEPVPGGNEPKVERFVTTRNVLAERRLRLPARTETLVAQLCEVVSKPMPGGGLQIVLPRRRGVHGDLVSAFVIATWAAAVAGEGIDLAEALAINGRFGRGLGLNEPPLPNHSGTRWGSSPGKGY